MNDVTTITFGLQAFVTLLVILDPPGATPIFLGVLGNRSRAERTLLAWQAAATSLFVITLFALFGQFIVGYLDISMPALKGAGGLLLLLVSLELLKGNDHKDDEGVKKNLALVPLGTPLLGGKHLHDPGPVSSCYWSAFNYWANSYVLHPCCLPD
jgi:multiple antibiotic resistance protein